MRTKTSGQTVGQNNNVLILFANFFSIVFHPVFITTYIIAFLIFVHPGAFIGYDPGNKIRKFFIVVFSDLFLPLFSVFIAWRLKLIKSLKLATTRERLIPYALVMIFYFWTWYVFKNFSDSPPVSVHLLLGSFLAICGGWMCNIYFKISMHAIAMGGLITFALLFAFNDSYSSGLYVSVAILVAGLVCTSRLITSDHTAFEIYAGLFVGMLTQFVAWQF